MDGRILLPQPLRGALVGAVDLGVVRQLARLPEARIERLVRLPGVVPAMRVEQVTAPVGQGDDISVARNNDAV